MGEPRAKGIRELRLGFADGGMSRSVCRSENISVGVAMAKRVKSSLEYVSVPAGESGARRAHI
jgi:hypothetical protein